MQLNTTNKDAAKLGLTPCQLPFAIPSDLISGIFQRDSKISGLAAGRQRRKLEFSAGRYAAENCLTELGIASEVGRAKDRSPVWPEGAVGSISHSDRFAWSAVGLAKDYASIGIDTEPIAERSTFNQLCEEIFNQGEEKFGDAMELDELQTFTTIFSAKESFYKCVYPMNPVFFGFHDVRVVCADSQTITMQLAKRSPNQFNSKKPIQIDYVVTGRDVFTACWLRPTDI